MFRIEFCTQKSASAYVLSPPWVELGDSKDQYVWNLTMYRNGKLNSPFLAQCCITSKKASNKSCSELNFKIPRMSISRRSWTRELQGSICLKSYNLQKWEIRFALWLNAVKNSDYMKNCFKQKLSRIKFSKKNLWSHFSISLWSGVRDNPFSNMWGGVKNWLTVLAQGDTILHK